MTFTITATSKYTKPAGRIPPIQILTAGDPSSGSPGNTVTTNAAITVPVVTLRVYASGTNPGRNALLQITRIHADGSRHQVLTEQAPRLAGGYWVWLDQHCPYNQPVTYEAAAEGYTCTTKKPLTILSAKAFLIHPSLGDFALRIDAVNKIGDMKASTRSAKFVPIGGPAVFLSDGMRDGLSGTIEFRIPAGDLPRWRSGIFKDDQVLLLNTPATAGWDLGWMWLQPGDVTYSNPGEITRYKWRHITMAYTAAADPVVDMEPAWSSADALAYWSAAHQFSQDMPTHYSDCLNFLVDTRI